MHAQHTWSKQTKARHHTCLQVAEMRRKFPLFSASAIEELVVMPWQTSAPQEPAERLPAAGPSRSISGVIPSITGKLTATMQLVWYLDNSM